MRKLVFVVLILLLSACSSTRVDPTGFWNGSFTAGNTVSATIDIERVGEVYLSTLQLGGNTFTPICNFSKHSGDFFCFLFSGFEKVTFSGPMFQNVWSGTWEYADAYETIVGTFRFSR